MPVNMTFTLFHIFVYLQNPGSSEPGFFIDAPKRYFTPRSFSFSEKPSYFEAKLSYSALSEAISSRTD